MKVTHYKFISDGMTVATARGNSRMGYSVDINGTTHVFQQAKRIRDVVSCVRYLCNIWSESPLETVRV